MHAGEPGVIPESRSDVILISSSNSSDHFFEALYPTYKSTIWQDVREELGDGIVGSMARDLLSHCTRSDHNILKLSPFFGCSHHLNRYQDISRIVEFARIQE